MELILSTKKIIKVLMLIVICLTLMSIAGQFYKYVWGHDRYLVKQFNLDEEWNIPTLYASFSLIFCSILLAIIAFFKKNASDRFSIHWIALSIIFLCLSLDEVLQLHEQINQPLRSLMNAQGVFYFAWVFPGAAFLLIFLLAFVKFLIKLPRKTRFLFIISAALYIFGVLAMELIGGMIADKNGQQNITYAMVTNVEEFFEMVGILIFIYTLMSYISSHLQDFRIRFIDK